MGNCMYKGSVVLKSSVQKASLICDLIRRRNVKDAASQLFYSKKDRARDILKLLYSVSSTAKNKGADLSNLFINEIYVGKKRVLKRGRARARGRYSRIFKPYSTVFLSLSNGEGDVKKNVVLSGGENGSKG